MGAQHGCVAATLLCVYSNSDICVNKSAEFASLIPWGAVMTHWASWLQRVMESLFD